MELTKPTAILFDWDNTLVDTWPTIHQALVTTFTAYGKTPWTLNETKEKVGRSMRDAFPQLFGETWLEAANHYRQSYRDIHLESLIAFEKAVETLNTLKENNIPMGLVSNKMGDTLRLEVTHLGWDDYFLTKIGANDAAEDKPHPAPVNMALGDMQLQADRKIWFMGDSEVDLEVGKASGLTPILYGNPELDKKKNHFRKQEFAHQFHNHQDIIRFLTA